SRGRSARGRGPPPAGGRRRTPRRPPARPPPPLAPSPARPARRPATNSTRAPRETRLRAVSSPTLPAPTSSTEDGRRSPKTCSASAAAAEDTDAGPSPIAVSERAFLPACSASRNRPGRTGPGAGGAPTVTGALRLAWNEGVEPSRDPKQMQSGRLAVKAVERGQKRLIIEPGETRERPHSLTLGGVLVGRPQIELRAVARREADRLVAQVGQLRR